MLARRIHSEEEVEARGDDNENTRTYTVLARSIFGQESHRRGFCSACKAGGGEAYLQGNGCKGRAESLDEEYTGYVDSPKHSARGG